MQTIGYLERGDYRPSLDLALRLGEYFNLPIETTFSHTPLARTSRDTLRARAGQEAA